MDKYRDFEKLKQILPGDPDNMHPDLGFWLQAIPESERNFEEQRNLLLMGMSWPIVCNGFCDLFYQAWTLTEYQTVISYLTELGRTREKNLLEEAFGIYVRGNENVTQEEFSQLDPFGKGPEWDRFDEIGNEFELGNDAINVAFEHFKLIAPAMYKQPALTDL